jgi:hypothetical protein
LKRCALDIILSNARKVANEFKTALSKLFDSKKDDPESSMVVVIISRNKYKK